MKTQSDIQKELSEISPFLSKIEKREEVKNGDPPLYFDRIQDRIVHQIYELEALKPKTAQSKSSERVSFFNFLFLPKTKFAFVFLVGFFLVGNFILNSKKSDMNKFSAFEMDSYFNQNMNELDENLIASVVSNDDLNVLIDDQTMNLEQFVEDEDVEI